MCAQATHQFVAEIFWIEMVSNKCYGMEGSLQEK